MSTGEASEHLSADEIVNLAEVSRQDVPIGLIHSLTPTGLPPHSLTLKPGVVVMLIRNIDVSSGLANGTRLVLVSANRVVLECKIASGEREGRTVFIPRMVFNYDSTNAPAHFNRFQFPIRPAFAITINKSQGQVSHGKKPL